MMVSASDDCTVKIWNWRTAGTVGFGKYATPPNKFLFSLFFMVLFN